MNALSKLIESNKVPHALLLVGKDVAPIAHQFAQDLGVTKTDLHEYFPEGKSDLHPIAHIRLLIQDVSLVPFQGKWKVFVIHNAEKMLPPSANALLKTLEEPTPNTAILLLTSYPDRLLTTIRSRCQSYFFQSAEKLDRSVVLKYLTGKIEARELSSIDHGLLLETLMLWHRDRYLLSLEGGELFLSFPEYREINAHASLFSLEKVTKSLAQAKLALSRSFSVEHVLDMFALSLHA